MRVKRARSSKQDTVDAQSIRDNTIVESIRENPDEENKTDDELFDTREMSLRGSIQSNSIRSSFMVGLKKAKKQKDEARLTEIANLGSLALQDVEQSE